MAITERLGTVITIREILMTVAYFLTGGLRCKDVHRLYEKNGRSEGWQPAYIFYNLLFSPPMTLSADKLARIPLLKELGKLDPGLVADRRVDEALINDPDIFSDASFELIFAGRLGRREAQVDARFGIDEIVADARSRDERDAEEEFTKRVIRSLRRRDFFDGHPEGDLAASRLGFNHYDDFRWILSGENDNSRKVMIKNHLIAGLHTIQGLRLARGESALLHLVDPAFGRSTNHAAIIAKKIASKHLKLIPQSERWGDLGEVRAFPLSQAVDWIDREVVLLYVDADGEKTLYPMDLLTFDCIMRAASGYVPANFYAHDIRRIMNFLSLLAERSGEIEPDKIDVMVAGHMHSVVLEEGDVISVGGELI
ncbi:hypothetical protein CYL16_06850 [Mycobacterium sp. EPG1]|nr:hypothetical protein CYL16_06850 [Mycobacterium sp. EPG1]